MKLPLLVAGGSGLIGRALTAHLLERGESVMATTRRQADLPNHFIRFDLAENSWPALPKCSAAVICAAVTRQDQCRQNPAATRHINVVRTLKLVRELIAADAFVVFLSTNLVFDGSKPECKPCERFSPQTEYGRQKAEAELVLAQWPDRVAIVRLTKVFHPGLPLLQRWRQELGASREVHAFSDYLCSPISLRTVVAVITRIASEERPGVWQLSGPADVSYAELALCVARFCGVDLSLVKSAPAPPGMLEQLPSHTTLDASRARDELGIAFPEAGKVLAECLADCSV